MSREGALWIGGLEPYMTESFLSEAMRMAGENKVISIKVIKNKYTGEPATYGFINFESDPVALMAMHKLNGKIIPGSQPPVRFKLNCNSTRLAPGEKDYSIFVGDLSQDVDDLQLFQFFAKRFNSVRSAKVVLDGTGFSKGYGFISFKEVSDQQTALISMMGMSGLGSKPIKVSIAVNRSKMGEPNLPGSTTPSITDTISSSTLAALVSKASGNPEAGTAVMEQSKNAQYYAQWQQYAQQQYWNQYAAWQQQQGEGYGETETYIDETPVLPSYDEFGKVDTLEGDENQLIDHCCGRPLVIGEENSRFVAKSEELWDAMTESLWWEPQETPPKKMDAAIFSKS